MNRSIVRFLGLLAFFGIWMIPLSHGEALAGIGVDVHVALPHVVISAPPALVVIPGTYVYIVPDIDADLLFFHGYWYRPYEGRWYVAGSYNGPWTYIRPYRVPPALVSLPPDYRRVPPGHHRIPYADLQANWSRWERERYWERDREWHAGREPEGRFSGRRFDERRGAFEGGYREPGRGHEEREGHGGRHG